LHYHIIDCRNRPLTTICFGTFSKEWSYSDKDLELALNILEKLGALLFQTLPAQTLAQFKVQAVYPNTHCNVLSPLFQSQGSRLGSKYIEEAIAFMQETDDQQILDYYRQHASGNPLKTLILERAIEKRGGTPHNYETLPEVIKMYLSKRGFSEKAEVEGLIAPGATLILFILLILQNLGQAAALALKAARAARASQATQSADLAFDPIILAWEDEEHSQPNRRDTAKDLAIPATIDDPIAKNNGKHEGYEVDSESLKSSDTGDHVKQRRT